MKNGTAQTLCVDPQLRSPLERPESYLRGVIRVLSELHVGDIERMVERLFEAYTKGRTVYLFGNGGSAALASHAACDLGKGTRVAGKRPFRVVSLADNVPLITAWANDANYGEVFSAQLLNLVEPEDIAFAISGSGNSVNVLSALRVAQQAGALTLGISGFNGGKMKELCDVCVIVPSENMQQIEDSHVCVVHAIFRALRERIANGTARLPA